ncbi:MAG: hypothetical protein CVU84_17070 [Firmicutes bacterium HGW-Firmicutes-1]|jgi:spore coat protein CotF|nr:MAG: hypothetical protein CVU84_17070 [Firmicutes bacterium HGW-Firmicutes-1]
MNNVRSDQDFANDLLLSEKQLCASIAIAATESATESIRNGFKNILSSQLDIQNQVFKTMSSNGWYSVDQADSSKIQQAKTTYSTFTV